MQADAPQIVNDNSIPFLLRAKSKEPELVADLTGPHHGKLKIWSSQLGEIHFFLKEGFHLSNIRGGMVAQGRAQVVPIAVVVGDNQYLDETGKISDIQIPESEIPSEEEAEDPPDEWVVPPLMGIGQVLDATVIEKRQKNVCSKVIDKVWDRIYLESSTLMLVQDGDPFFEIEVLEGWMIPYWKQKKGIQRIQP